jgi:hypothetical protein
MDPQVLGTAGTPSLQVPERWEDVTPEWMTEAIAGHHPGARVGDVELVLRDDGTNRRARFALTYAAGSGPASAFLKAESDAPGRRKIHARNGNLFNEPKLFASGIALPIEHPRAYAAVVDEVNLDYVIVMEDLLSRGADPRDATRPLTVDEVSRGLLGLARLHSRYWGKVGSEAALSWVQPFTPSRGWLKPMEVGVPMGLEQAGDGVPEDIRRRPVEEILHIWTSYVRSLTTGPQTLLHGDPHIGNTYVLPDGGIGFLDWQVVRSGSWVHDVGYFIVSSLTEPDRRHHERELVEIYRTSLDLSEEERPTAEEAWLRYRATPAHGLPIWLITLLSDVHAQERTSALIRRYAAAFVELDTPSAVEQIGR